MVMVEVHSKEKSRGSYEDFEVTLTIKVTIVSWGSRSNHERYCDHCTEDHSKKALLVEITNMEMLLK